MEKLTFESLPSAVQVMDQKIDRLEQLINSLGHEEPDFWGGPDWVCNYLSSDEGKPLPKPTLYGWVQNNKIPCSKKGKRLYFSKLEIDEWLREGRK
jgi:hypothetical protein